MRTRITRDSGTSQVARIARARARYESTRSVRALRSVDDGKSSDRAVSSLAAEGIINTPDTDTRGVVSLTPEYHLMYRRHKRSRSPDLSTIREKKKKRY